MAAGTFNRTRNRARKTLSRLTVDRPVARQVLLKADNWIEQQRHALAGVFPSVIKPRPARLFLALTGHCNWRCLGCRYERDFMVGEQLSLDLIKTAIEDARDAGIHRVRLYGGEPLLHPDLPAIVAHCRRLRLTPFVTTNATLLEQKIDELYEAGLRDISVGFYGLGPDMDAYTQRPGHFARFERGLAAVHRQYGDTVTLQLNWLLRRDTCDPQILRSAFAFCLKYGARFHVDLIHYSLPYFIEGQDHALYFRPDDRPRIDSVVRELLRLKNDHPDVVTATPEMIRSMPDWLLLGPKMRVPCTAAEIIWIGPDGTVQLCYVTFKLGNLHERRLREMLFTPAHIDAARRAFALDCPNCHCEAGDRIMRHGPSKARYQDVRTPKAAGEGLTLPRDSVH
jgi:cyclic pyranopterin phosphate synthase